jgi:hypothetical protein
MGRAVGSNGVDHGRAELNRDPMLSSATLRARYEPVRALARLWETRTLSIAGSFRVCKNDRGFRSPAPPRRLRRVFVSRC